MERQTLNVQEAGAVIRNLVEYTENLGTAATIFKDHVANAHQQSDLTFLGTIATGLGKIEENVRNLTASCEDIQKGLRGYANEFSNFEDDTQGLY